LSGWLQGPCSEQNLLAGHTHQPSELLAFHTSRASRCHFASFFHLTLLNVVQVHLHGGNTVFARSANKTAVLAIVCKKQLISNDRGGGKSAVLATSMQQFVTVSGVAAAATMSEF
jgi:hypothetical protein